MKDSWTSRTLPELPARPEWLGEGSYAEIQRAHMEALTRLTLAEAHEAEAQRRRADANRAAMHYDNLLMELTQLTIDDLTRQA